MIFNQLYDHALQVQGSYGQRWQHTYLSIILGFHWIRNLRNRNDFRNPPLSRKTTRRNWRIEMYVIKGRAEPITNFTNFKGTPSRPTESDLVWYIKSKTSLRVTNLKENVGKSKTEPAFIGRVSGVGPVLTDEKISLRRLGSIFTNAFSLSRIPIESRFRHKFLTGKFGLRSRPM
jgi:hypothetical protein